MAPNILVVDDDHLILNMIADFLRNEGHSFDLADGAAKAFKLLESKKYDIVLLDKNMPGLNGKGEEGGMDILRHIRSQLIPSETIMLTGYATIDTAIEAMKLGAFDYLLKPFSLENLRSKINRLLEYRSFFDPDKTIDIYKGIRSEILHLIENKSSLMDSELDKSLVSLNKKIDKLFRLFKESERLILVQRESLANVAVCAEQLKLVCSETDQGNRLINEITKYAGMRL
jgi:DNA-binding NtrC family response regulator